MALQGGGPPQNGMEEPRSLDVPPGGEPRHPHDWDIPEDDPHDVQDQYVVECVYRDSNNIERVGEFREWQVWGAIRGAFESNLPNDDNVYEVESITEVGTGRDLGVDLDQPILAHLRVVGIARGPPSGPDPGRSLQVRDREPGPGSPSELPPARRRRQEYGEEGRRLAGPWYIEPWFIEPRTTSSTGSWTAPGPA